MMIIQQTLLTPKNPKNEKKSFPVNLKLITIQKTQITDYIDAHPDQTPLDVINWMKENIDLGLHFEDSQVRGMVFWKE